MNVDCSVKINFCRSIGDSEWNCDRNSKVILPDGEINGMCVGHENGEGGSGMDKVDLSSCRRCGGMCNELRRLSSWECSLSARDK